MALYNAQGNRVLNIDNLSVSEGKMATKEQKEVTNSFIKELGKKLKEDEVGVCNSRLNPNNVFADFANHIYNHIDSSEWLAYAVAKFSKLIKTKTDYMLVPMIYAFDNKDMKSVWGAQNTRITNVISEQLMNCNDAQKDSIVDYAMKHNYIAKEPQSNAEFKELFKRLMSDPSICDEIAEIAQGKEFIYDANGKGYFLIGDNGAGMANRGLFTSIFNVGNSNKKHKPWVQGKFGGGRTSSLQVTDSQVILTRTDENSPYSLVIIQQGEYKYEGENTRVACYYALMEQSTYEKGINKPKKNILPQVDTAYTDATMTSMLDSVIIPEFSNSCFSGELLKGFKHGTKIKFFYSNEDITKDIQSIGKTLYDTFAYECFKTNVYSKSASKMNLEDTFKGRNGDIEDGKYADKLYGGKVYREELTVKGFDNRHPEVEIKIPVEYGIINRMVVKEKEERAKLLHNHYRCFIHNDQIQAQYRHGDDDITLQITSKYARNDMFIDIHTGLIPQLYIMSVYSASRDGLHLDTPITNAIIKAVSNYFEELLENKDSVLSRYDREVEEYLNGKNPLNTGLKILYNPIYKFAPTQATILAHNVVEGATSEGSLNITKDNTIALCFRIRTYSSAVNTEVIDEAIKDDRCNVRLKYDIFDNIKDAREINYKDLTRDYKDDENCPFEIATVKMNDGTVGRSVIATANIPLCNGEKIPGVVLNLSTEKIPSEYANKVLRLSFSLSIKPKDGGNKLFLVHGSNVIYKMAAIDSELSSKKENGYLVQNKGIIGRRTALVTTNSTDVTMKPQSIYGEDEGGIGEMPEVTGDGSPKEKTKATRKDTFKNPTDRGLVESSKVNVERKSILEEGIGKNKSQARSGKRCRFATAMDKNGKADIRLRMYVITKDGTLNKMPKILMENNFSATTVDKMIESSGNERVYSIFKNKNIFKQSAAIPVLHADMKTVESIYINGTSEELIKKLSSDNGSEFLSKLVSSSYAQATSSIDGVYAHVLNLCGDDESKVNGQFAKTMMSYSPFVLSRKTFEI